MLLECLTSSKGVLVVAFWSACLFNRLSVYYLPILPLSTFVLICPYQFLPWQYVEAIKKYGSRFKKFLSLKILGSPNRFYLYCQVFQISLIWNLKNVCEAFLLNIWESGDLCSLQTSPQTFQVWSHIYDRLQDFSIYGFLILWPQISFLQMRSRLFEFPVYFLL